MKYKWIVYITINQCNGKFYIGVHKTINPDVFDGYIGGGVYSQSGAKRIQRNKRKEGKEIPFVNAVVKYGYENFKRTTLVVFDEEKSAFDLEELLVNKTLLRSKQCYNLAKGGKSGSCILIEKRIYQFSLDGNFMRSYKSIQLAADTVGVDQANIVACLNGRQHTCAGYYWNYEKKFDYKPYEHEKAVCQYTISGKFIAKWDSIKEASLAYHLSSGICRAIRTKNTSGGYQWRYFDGSYDDIEPWVDPRKKKKDGDIV